MKYEAQIRDRIDEELTKRGWTKSSLTKETGIDRTTMYHLLHGRRFNEEQLKKISKAFNVPIYALFGKSDLAKIIELGNIEYIKMKEIEIIKKKEIELKNKVDNIKKKINQLNTKQIDMINRTPGKIVAYINKNIENNKTKENTKIFTK